MHPTRSASILALLAGLDPTLCSVEDAGGAPAGGGGAPAVAPPASPAQAPAPAAAPAARPAPLPQLSRAGDDGATAQRIKENTIAVLRGAGVKIPKELRQTADPAQIVEFARDKLGKIKGGSKEARRAVKTAEATISKHEATIAKLAADNAVIGVYAQAEIDAMPKEQAAAFRKVYGIDADKPVPVDRAAEVLKQLTLTRLAQAGMAPPAPSAAPPAAPQAPALPPAAPAAVPPQAPAALPPIAAPATTAPAGGGPTPTPPSGASTRAEYERLAAAARANPGDPRLRLQARIFRINNDRELQQAVQAR